MGLLQFCWMLFGTSNTFTKSGPVDSVFITNILQNIQETCGNIHENVISSYLNVSKLQNFKNVGHYRTSSVRELFSWNFEISKLCHIAT